jgi:predicted MFS family arabinose efflux permease
MHGVGANSRVVLVPQPSNDPNDPLNWSGIKKITILSIIALGIILCAATNSVLLNAGLVKISQELGVTIPQVARLSSYMLLVGGASSPVVCALARKCAKWPCFVFSSVLTLVVTIIGSATSYYHVLIATQPIQGFAVIAYEALSVSVIGDLHA